MVILRLMMSCSASRMSPMLGLPLGLQVHFRASWAPNTHVMEVLSMERLVASEAPSSYVNLAHKTIDQISP